MLWAHREATRTARPDPFFETLLPLDDWIAADAELAITLAEIVRLRPMRRAQAFAQEYREYRAKRDAGGNDGWAAFASGLFNP